MKRSTVMGMRTKNRRLSPFVKAGLKKRNIWKISKGALIINAEDRPISIDKSANWNGDVVAITTFCISKIHNMKWRM